MKLGAVRTRGRKSPGEIIRTLRGEETLKVFGPKLGITQQHLWAVEEGKRTVSVKVARKAIELSSGEYSLEDFLVVKQA